jgi:hypothetical protein
MHRPTEFGHNRQPYRISAILKTHIYIYIYIYIFKVTQVYFLEYTDIPEVLFTPHHVGHCCTNVIRLHLPLRSFSHSCDPSSLLRDSVFLQWGAQSHCCATVTRGHAGCLRRRKNATDIAVDRRTDVDGPARCSSLTLEREEHVISQKMYAQGNSSGASFCHCLWAIFSNRDCWLCCPTCFKMIS